MKKNQSPIIKPVKLTVKTTKTTKTSRSFNLDIGCPGKKYSDISRMGSWVSFMS